MYEEDEDEYGDFEEEESEEEGEEEKSDELRVGALGIQMCLDS